MLRRSAQTTLWLVLISFPAVAADLPVSRQRSAEVFTDQVAVLLETHCVRCHGPQQQESGLRLDQAELLSRGGDRGAAVVAGDPQTSLLYRAVTPADDELQMPPEGDPLPQEAIEAIHDWIAGGAVWPESVAKLTARFQISAEDRAYWAFVPPADVAVPGADSGSGSCAGSAPPPPITFFIIF